MKKTTVLAIAGFILSFFIVSAFGNRQRLYEKKETFKTPEDSIVNFIGYINTFDKVKMDSGYYNVTSREFLESISKRYRLYVGSNSTYRFISQEVPVLFRYDIKEVDYNSLINLKSEYENSYKNLVNYTRDSNPRIYKLDGYGSHNKNVEKYSVKEDGTVSNEYEEEVPVTIYLVVVNEGEGYVVDYYSVVYQ